MKPRQQGITMNIIKSLFFYIHKVFPQIPAITQLPFGMWWVIYRDAASVTVLDNEWELAERQFMLNFLDSGMVFIDIGASYGFYTLLASSLVEPCGKVISFEPNPTVRRRLFFHVMVNRCNNVILEGIALSDSVGEREFYIVREHSDLSGFATPVDCDYIRIIVETNTLDQYLKQRGIYYKVDLVKVDVEGAELQVLMGSRQLLTHRPRPLWLIELLDSNTVQFGYLAVEVVKFLNNKNFLWFKITDEGYLSPMSREQTSFNNVERRNYLAIPEERIQEVKHLIQSL